ncbi:hypothetical protein CYL15_08455 [Geobacillus thermodenitrificans]|nr:hypothetical protein [Geobacillus thermodenitrificans]
MHVLGTPPAFVLSQDQTLERKLIGLRFVSFSFQGTRLVDINCFLLQEPVHRTYLSQAASLY